MIAPSRSVGKSAASICLLVLFVLAITRFFKPEICKYSVPIYYGLEAAIILLFFLICAFLAKTLPIVEVSHLPPTHQKLLPFKSSDPLLTLRAFACFMVLAGHGFLISFVPGTLAQDVRSHTIYKYLIPEPWAGVWIFFTLSGYLMGKGFFLKRYSLTTLGMSMFYRNRVLRIYPLYFVATITVALLENPQFFYPDQILSAVSLLVFFDFNQTPIIPIGALWSVGTEMEFYLMVPFLFTLFGEFLMTRRHSWLPFAIIALSGLTLRTLVYHSMPDRVYGGPLLGNMDFFLAGFCVNPIVRKLHSTKLCVPGITLGLMLVAVLYGVSGYFCLHGRLLQEPKLWRAEQVYLPSAIAAVTALIIICMETSQIQGESPIVQKLVGHTQTLGLLTYAMYTCHEPINWAAQKALGGSLSLPTSLEMLLLNLLKVIGVSFFIFHYIELYFDRKKSTEANYVRKRL